MQPIRQLLNRIRWDQEFGRGTFELGYYDRVEQRIIRVPFERLSFEPAQDLFRVTDLEGVTHTIPYHRIREVHRNGALIWQRPG